MKQFSLKILRWMLKLMANLTVRRYRPKIVGITGSVGKTSTKEMIRNVLSGQKKIRASSKNFNNEIGLPLTILGSWHCVGGIFFWLKVFVFSFFQLIFKNPNYPEVLVLEYGIDRPGDMKYLLSISEPTISVFTAMGEIPVHVEFFPSPEGVLREKAKIINKLPATGFAVLNSDDRLVFGLNGLTRAQSISFGFSEAADLRIVNFSNYFEDKNAGIKFKLTYGGSFVPITINGVLGKAQAKSAAASAAVGLIFDINLVKISEALTEYKTPPGRMRFLEGKNNTFIIDDTYNSSPVAVRESIDSLKTKFCGIKRKIIVFGDMLELGKHTLEAHQKIGREIPNYVKILITVGARANAIAESAEKNGMSKNRIFSFSNLKEVKDFLVENLKEGDLVLIKGSQGVRLERVVKAILAEHLNPFEFLVRQEKSWLLEKGLYDEGELGD